MYITHPIKKYILYIYVLYTYSDYYNSLFLILFIIHKYIYIHTIYHLSVKGLWDIMTPQMAVNYVRKRLSEYSQKRKSCDLQEITKELVAEAINRGSVDNVSVIILTFNG